MGRLADDPSVADAIVGFHAQQATEKALKAVLASRTCCTSRSSMTLFGSIELGRFHDIPISS